jgi:hypothetical protein
MVDMSGEMNTKTSYFVTYVWVGNFNNQIHLQITKRFKLAQNQRWRHLIYQHSFRTVPHKHDVYVGLCSQVVVQILTYSFCPK